MVLRTVVLIGLHCISFSGGLIPQQPLEFNIKEAYTFYSFHFHKGAVDKHIFKKAETEVGLTVNNKKIKCKLWQLQFLHKITVILSFLKDVNGKFLVFPWKCNKWEIVVFCVICIKQHTL